MSELDRFKEILRSSGASMTSARQAIFETLLRSDRPLKNGEIAQLTPSVNRASVYRTLELFDRLGITTTTSRGWTPLTELAEPFKPHHHHIHCTNCRQIEAINTPELEQLIERLARGNGYQMTSHHIELYGMCPACQDNFTNH